MSFGSNGRPEEYVTSEDRSRARHGEVADAEPQVVPGTSADRGVAGAGADEMAGEGTARRMPDERGGDLGELDAGRLRHRRDREPAGNMLPGRERRRFLIERLLMRLVATCGVVGIGTALGAVLVSSNVRGWITGLVVALVSVTLSAILWSSRQV